MRGLHRAQEDWRTDRLLSFIPQVTPEFASPLHLKSLVELLEQADSGEAHAVVSTPPQHGKSQTVLHELVRRLKSRPRERHAYITYAAQFSREQSYIARQIAERAGLRLEAESLDRWRTPQGGGIIFAGVGGPLTGHAVDGLMVVDDPIKNRLEAESPLIRGRIYDWFTSVALTRLHPRASIIVIATRWRPDDLPGRLIEEGWKSVILPAINEHGEPLWPEQRPLEWLLARKARIGEYDWASMYQGQPRPRGGTLFQDVHYYDDLPEGSYRAGCGVDWAYTAKTHADYSVALEGRMYGDTLYLTRMIRQQTEAPAFAERLRGVEARQLHSYMSGTEKALEQFIRKTLGLSIQMLPTTTDKYVRAQDVAAAWNDGRVLVPRGATWLGELIDEVLSFTGVNDEHDDVCFVAGTMIQTPTGPRPIETMQPGDFVETRQGACPVIASGRTAQKARVFTVTFSDGRSLTASGNHPVYVQNKGFVRVDALARYDRIIAWETKTQSGNASRITASIITAIQTLSTPVTGATLAMFMQRAKAWSTTCIGRYGARPTATFPKVWLFITKMVTLLIMPLKTLNASLRPHMPFCTMLPLEVAAQNRSSILSALERRPQLGTSRVWVKGGISNTASELGRDAPPWPQFVKAAKASTRPTSQHVAGHVLKGAKRLYGKVPSILAPFVARRSMNKPVGNERIAVIHVVTVRERARPEPVYNLTVGEAHEYFANGVLVHNCDALASLWAAFDSRGLRILDL